MAKRLETSLESFARRDSPFTWLGLSALIVGTLLILLIVSAVAKDWLYAGPIGLALIAAIAFTIRNLISYRSLAARSEQKRINWETAEPDIQRENLNVEVLELCKILEVESGQISDLQSAYIVAEDLALRQIQQEENVPLMRHVTIGRAPFDAVLVKNDVVSCIEVSFLVAPDLRQEKISAMMRKIALVKKSFQEMGFTMRVRLTMVLVTQLGPEDDELLRARLSKQRFEDTPVDIDIRLLDFESLQRIYVTD